MEFVTSLHDLEKRVQERPCTRDGLKSLERELEEQLKTHREGDPERLPTTISGPNISELLVATDAVRIALHQGFLAHDLAQFEIEQVQELVARGHIRAAVMATNTIRHKLEDFSDLNLDFVAKAETQHDLRQERLIILGVILTAGILLATIIVELLRRAKTH